MFVAHPLQEKGINAAQGCLEVDLHIKQWHAIAHEIRHKYNEPI